MLVPITRRATFEDTYEFAELLSRRLEREHPGEVTTEWLKKKRSGVLVDHRQNGCGKTIASVYSVRPKPGAPVSTPLRWEELTDDVRPRDFTMAVALERVARHGDLFEPVLRGGQALGAGAQALAGGCWRLTGSPSRRSRRRRDARARVRDVRLGPVREPDGPCGRALAARGPAARADAVATRRPAAEGRLLRRPLVPGPRERRVPR